MRLSLKKSEICFKLVDALKSKNFHLEVNFSPSVNAERSFMVRFRPWDPTNLRFGENTPSVDACAELHFQMKISDLNAPVYYLLEAKKSHIYIKLSENVISSPFSACSWFSKIESMFSKVQNAQLLDFLHMKGSKTLEFSVLHRMVLLRIKNRVPNAI